MYDFFIPTMQSKTTLNVKSIIEFKNMKVINGRFFRIYVWYEKNHNLLFLLINNNI